MAVTHKNFIYNNSIVNDSMETSRTLFDIILESKNIRIIICMIENYDIKIYTHSNGLTILEYLFKHHIYNLKIFKLLFEKEYDINKPIMCQDPLYLLIRGMISTRSCPQTMNDKSFVEYENAQFIKLVSFFVKHTNIILDCSYKQVFQVHPVYTIITGMYKKYHSKNQVHINNWTFIFKKIIH